MLAARPAADRSKTHRSRLNPAMRVTALPGIHLLVAACRHADDALAEDAPWVCAYDSGNPQAPPHLSLRQTGGKAMLAQSDAGWQILIIPLLVALASALFLLYFWKKMKAVTTATAKVPPADLDGRIKCPRCGRDMAHGFIIAPRGIMWQDSTDKRAGLVAAPWNVLENTLSMTMRPQRNSAWRCASCRVLTVDHSVMIS
jgi:hypothetical protein